MSGAELCIYLKRMREYNSFLADYSKRDANITLYKSIFGLFDNRVKSISLLSLSDDFGKIDALYKNIYEMSCALPETFLDYVRNKLTAYLALLKKLEKDREMDTKMTFKRVFQKDLFFFMKL